MMGDAKGASSYRWVVLVAYMLVTVAIEVQWLTHAPIARAAEVFYAGQFDPSSILNIDSFATSYMLLFIVMSIPASYVIGRWGIRIGVGVGIVILGMASLGKALFAASFAAVLTFQVALAVAQPFILNAVTALTARWFPLAERGLAAGLAALAQYLGIIIAMVFTPMLVETSPLSASYGAGIERMLAIYGVASAAVSLVALALIRERPAAGLPGESFQAQGFAEGFRHIFRQPSMIIAIALFFVGLGIFNTVSSMVDSIASYLGVIDSDGLIGALMLGGGVVGAVVLPAVSDRYQVRKPFIVLCMAGMVAGIGLMSFASELSSDGEVAYRIALLASFILGFFVMSAGPIGFQYAAEISAPAAESTSQGLLLLSGQISGVLFVVGMSIRENAYLPFFMTLFVFLAAAALVGSFFLKESLAGREAA